MRANVVSVVDYLLPVRTIVVVAVDALLADIGPDALSTTIRPQLEGRAVASRLCIINVT